MAYTVPVGLALPDGILSSQQMLAWGTSIPVPLLCLLPFLGLAPSLPCATWVLCPASSWQGGAREGDDCVLVLSPPSPPTLHHHPN